MHNRGGEEASAKASARSFINLDSWRLDSLESVREAPFRYVTFGSDFTTGGGILRSIIETPLSGGDLLFNNPPVYKWCCYGKETEHENPGGLICFAIVLDGNRISLVEILLRQLTRTYSCSATSDETAGVRRARTHF
ncbi:hypothetical protein Tco_0892509 [Tanacetum coccineum]|uniref:Uncharacterized protein n=1 Tax=Tanacetum coccineum TaxID=301880 RepID=A0ABQ5C937_9ASTR